MNALEISRTGLDVEWRRMEVIAQNIANINTTRTGDGGAYVPLRLVSGPQARFSQILGRSDQEADGANALGGVQVYGIEEVAGGIRRAYEPGHPHADPDGFVSYPRVSQAEEMTLMIKASRAYEANLVAIASAQQMYSSALQIGGRS